MLPKQVGSAALNLGAWPSNGTLEKIRGLRLDADQADYLEAGLKEPKRLRLDLAKQTRTSLGFGNTAAAYSAQRPPHLARAAMRFNAEVSRLVGLHSWLK